MNADLDIRNVDAAVSSVEPFNYVHRQAQDNGWFSFFKAMLR